MCFSDNTKLSSLFQPSYDDAGYAQEKDDGRNDTAGKEAIEEDWIIVDGSKIGSADGEQHQQCSLLQNVDEVFNAEVLGGSNEAKVDEVFYAEVPGGRNEAKDNEVLDAGVLGGSNEAIVDKVLDELPSGATDKVDVEDSLSFKGNFNQTAYVMFKTSISRRVKLILENLIYTNL